MQHIPCPPFPARPPPHRVPISLTAGDSFLLPPSPNGTSVVVVVQLLSLVQLFSTLWTATCQASLSFTVFWSLLKFMSIESVILSNHLILYHFLLLLPSIFSNESALRIRWPKYGSFSISPYNEYSGLIPFRIDWIDLLAVQGNLKSLLQHHSSKVPILQHSAFFIVQLSHPYVTPGKIVASLYRDLSTKWYLCFFNMLSRFVIAFLPRSKCLLISWLQSPSAVILEPKKIKSVTVSIFPHLFAVKWWNRMPWS